MEYGGVEYGVYYHRNVEYYSGLDFRSVAFLAWTLYVAPIDWKSSQFCNPQPLNT